MKRVARCGVKASGSNLDLRAKDRLNRLRSLTRSESNMAANVGDLLRLGLRTNGGEQGRVE